MGVSYGTTKVQTDGFIMIREASRQKRGEKASAKKTEHVLTTLETAKKNGQWIADSSEVKLQTALTILIDA